MLSEDIGGGLQLQAVVGLLGVVPPYPVEQPIVEAYEVAKQQVFMVVDARVLEGAVKARAMGMHLRCLGVGVPVQQALSADGLVFGALGAIVHALEWARQQALADVPSEASPGAGERLHSHGAAEAAVEIRAGDQMAVNAVAHPLNTVPSQTLARGVGHQPLGFTGALRTRIALTRPHDGTVRHPAPLVRAIGNASADGAHRWTHESLCLAAAA
jgi:hypothetical protein